MLGDQMVLPCCMQEKLVGSVGGVIRSQMALLGWPPPLTSTTSLLTQAWQGLEGADDRV